MTKKDYVALAEILKATKEAAHQSLFLGHEDLLLVVGTIESVQGGIAYLCAQDNPRFDSERFHAACDISRPTIDVYA